jgi:hypothetical protein
MTALVLSASVAMFSCVVVHDHPPRHVSSGYVYYSEPDGVRLVYHAGLGVYVVEGYRDCYYHQGRFYRVQDGVWVTTSNFKAGKWTRAKRNSLPPGLAKKMG